MKKRKIIKTLVQMQNIEAANAIALKESIDRPKDHLDRLTYTKDEAMKKVHHDCVVRSNILEKALNTITDGTNQKG